MTGSTFCNRCGHRNSGDRFSCALCDALLPQPGGAPTAAHAPVLPTTPDSSAADVVAGLDRTGGPCLVVTRGPLAGSRFMLGDDTVTVGRDPRSDVFLDDVTVSRQQAEIRRRGSALVVVDTGSFNGTYLNGVRIDGETVLAQGDELRIGKFRLFYLEP